jgi:D-alanyl-D-alanine carboxypeptidase
MSAKTSFHSPLRARQARPAGLVVALALAGVAALLATDVQAAPAPSPSAVIDGPALAVDQAAATAQLKQLAEELMLPGAALLIRTPDGEITATYGTTELHGSTPVSLEDHVRVGSNTKTWTATAILQLVQEGKIALEDSVSLYRPDVPNGENITIKELLNMTSGLFNYTETYYLNNEMDTNPQRVWDPEELVELGVGCRRILRREPVGTTQTRTTFFSDSLPSRSKASHCRRSFRSVSSPRWG